MEYFIAAQLGVTYLWFKSRPLPPLKPLKEKKELPKSEEYFPLDRDLSKINWDHLRRLLAFNTGSFLSLKPEFIEGSKDMKRLDEVPDVLPFKLTGNPGQINWETITEAEKAKFLE